MRTTIKPKPFNDRGSFHCFGFVHNLFALHSLKMTIAGSIMWPLSKSGRKEDSFVRRFVFLALTLIQMVFIFGMSAQQGDQSGELSNKVCKVICYVFVDGYSEMDYWTQQQYIERLSYPVRKGAHMTEYAVLGVFLMETTYSFRFDKLRKKKGKRRKGFFGQLFWSFNIGALYACADEYHQLYVVNRAGQAQDVLFDIAGLCVGLMVAYLIQKLRVWRLWRRPDFDPLKYENFAYDYGIPMRKYKE